MLVLNNFLPLLLSHVPPPQRHTLLFSLLGHELHCPTPVSHSPISRSLTEKRTGPCAGVFGNLDRGLCKEISFSCLSKPCLKKNTTFTVCVWGTQGFQWRPPRAMIFIQIDQDSGLGPKERSPRQSPQVCFESFLESWQAYKCTNRVENWFCRDTKVGKSALTQWRLKQKFLLSTGEQKFFYKKNICLITISPFLFILDINTQNVAKCILLHRTESVPDTQTLAQNPSDSSPRARIYFSSNVNSSQFQCCSSKLFLR